MTASLSPRNSMEIATRIYTPSLPEEITRHILCQLTREELLHLGPINRQIQRQKINILNFRSRLATKLSKLMIGTDKVGGLIPEILGECKVPLKKERIGYEQFPKSISVEFFKELQSPIIQVRDIFERQFFSFLAINNNDKSKVVMTLHQLKKDGKVWVFYSNPPHALGKNTYTLDQTVLSKVVKILFDSHPQYKLVN